MTYSDFFLTDFSAEALSLTLRFDPVSAHSVLFQQISLVSNFKVFCKKKETMDLFASSDYTYRV